MVSADKNGLSDPYVKAKIIPEAEDGEAKYKTKTCRKNLNPEFNETFIIDIKPADRSKRLLVEVTTGPWIDFERHKRSPQKWLVLTPGLVPSGYFLSG